MSLWASFEDATPEQKRQQVHTAISFADAQLESLYQPRLNTIDARIDGQEKTLAQLYKPITTSVRKAVKRGDKTLTNLASVSNGLTPREVVQTGRVPTPLDRTGGSDVGETLVEQDQCLYSLHMSGDDGNTGKMPSPKRCSNIGARWECTSYNLTGNAAKLLCDQLNAMEPPNSPHRCQIIGPSGGKECLGVGDGGIGDVIPPIDSKCPPGYHLELVSGSKSWEPNVDLPYWDKPLQLMPCDPRPGHPEDCPDQYIPGGVYECVADRPPKCPDPVFACPPPQVNVKCPEPKVEVVVKPQVNCPEIPDPPDVYVGPINITVKAPDIPTPTIKFPDCINVVQSRPKQKQETDDEDKSADDSSNEPECEPIPECLPCGEFDDPAFLHQKCYREIRIRSAVQQELTDDYASGGPTTTQMMTRVIAAMGELSPLPEEFGMFI